MATTQKVSVYSVNDLKNATDDAIGPYLTSLPKPYAFKQQHSQTNVRLLVGYTAVVIAGVLFYADWKLGWDATKAYTAPACIFYFLLNGFLTYWIWGIESGTVFVGVREGGQKVSIKPSCVESSHYNTPPHKEESDVLGKIQLSLKSSSKKFSPLYSLKILYEPPSAAAGNSSVKWEDKTVTGSFMTWFSKEGYLQQKELKCWLANNIEVVGLADPQSRQLGEEKHQGIVDDALGEDESAEPVSTDSHTQIPAAKARKGRKKA